MPQTNLPLLLTQKTEDPPVLELQGSLSDIRRRLITMLSSYLKIKTAVITDSITVPIDTTTDATIFNIIPTGTLTIQLPDATQTKDTTYFFHRSDGSGNSVALVPVSGQSVEGGNDVRNLEVRAIVSDGTNWLSLYTNSSQDWVNVRQGGAAGDGVTDDSANIQASIDSLPAGGVVFFPAGSYAIGTALSITAGITLLGASSTTVTLIGSVDPLIINSDSGTNYKVSELTLENGGVSFSNASRVICSDLIIDGATNGILLTDCTYPVLSTVTVVNGSGEGILLIATGSGLGDYATITSCNITDQNQGVVLQNVRHGVLSGCTVVNATGNAIEIDGCSDWKVIGCDAATGVAANGIAVDNSSSLITITGCTLYECASGIALLGERSSVTGSILHDNTNSDINLDDAASNYNVLSGNGCHSALASPIFSSLGDYNLVVGNVVHGAVTVAGANSVTANNVSY